jgi:transcriptional regulator with XRE-family HTH domain
MKEFNYKKLGKDLYNRRGKQMTLVETSQKIGVNTVTLSNIERGVGQGYTIRVILLITEFIGSKLDDYVE